MTRLLSLITLLCFSVAANADIYFCVAERYGQIRLSGSSILEKESLSSTYNTIIDTERGIKISGVGPYEGNCTESSNLIICQHIDEGNYITVLIDIISYPMQYSNVHQKASSINDRGPMFYGEIGECTKT